MEEVRLRSFKVRVEVDHTSWSDLETSW
jgi:hypothetical protein